MADTNTYTSKQKVEKWTTKEKFNALGDLRDIEPGTEYNITGAIEEGELDSALQSKINGKLTAPTTPTADSVVTMLANGTTGTKPLSEFSGKLYCHKVTVNVQYSPTQSMSVVLNNIYNTSQTALTTKELLSPYMTSIGIGCISDFQSESEGTGSPTSVGCILINNTSASVILFGTVTSDSAFGTVSDNYNINSIIDTVTEL